MNRLTLLIPSVAVVFLIYAGTAQADGLDDWLQVRVNARVKATVEDQAKATAGKKKTTQVEDVSVDHGSTNFVDQTSGTDLLSTAFSFVPMKGAASGQSGSGTISASAYSIYALATQQDPLTPGVYNSHADMRQLFFTAGREQKSDAASATDPLGSIFGVKGLILNKRDATSIASDPAASAALAAVLGELASVSSSSRLRILEVLYNANVANKAGTSQIAYSNTLNSSGDVDNEVAKLKPTDRAIVDDIARVYVDRVERANLQSVVDALQKRPQFAVDFQTRQRPGSAADDYRVQLIYDQGISGSWMVTLNGSYNYSNSRAIGADVRGGRAALEFKYNFTSTAGSTLRSPMQLAFSGESTRQSTVWKYRAQMRLVVPLAVGINVPVSFGYGNQSDILSQQEKDVYGKFGVTFDFGKIVQMAQSQH